MADPIHQFELKPIFRLGHVGSTEIVFTNASLFMFCALGWNSFWSRPAAVPCCEISVSRFGTSVLFGSLRSIAPNDCSIRVRSWSSRS